MLGDGLGADESDVRDAGVRGEVRSRLRPEEKGLHELWGVAAGGEGLAGYGGEVGGRPGGTFGGLDDDGVACEEAGYHGTEEVVEGIVPGDEGGYDAQGFPSDFVGLVAHEEVGRPLLGLQSLFAVRDDPLQLLGCD